MKHGITEFFGATELFVDHAAFRAWLAQAEQKAAALQTAGGVEAAMQAYGDREKGPRLVGDVAVIDVCGPITYKSGWMSYYYGGASIEDLQQKFRMALADPAVRTILFRFDSPGGEVTMVPEFADELFAARGLKPIVAVADTLVASAAYWLAAQADTIYTPVSGRLGSIGVFTEHADYSEYLKTAGIAITLISYGAHKTDGHPYAPLPDDVRARIQARVNEVGKEFDGAVARGRKVSTQDVADTFGQGEVFRGKRSIALGLADKLGTFSQVIARLTKNRGAGGGMVAGPVEGFIQTPADFEPVGAVDIAELPDRVAAALDDDEEPENVPCAKCRESGCDCGAETCAADCATCTPSCACRQAGDDEGAAAGATLAALLAAE